MKKILSLAAIVLSLSACSGQQAQEAAAPVNVKSLAGDVAITDTLPAEAKATYPSRGTALERDFVHMPPLIPHKDSYKLTTKKNGCLTCHSTEKAARMKATPVHESHLSADGKFDDKYYFCVQCHVAQADNKEALVGNTHTN
ncbi:MULTISPECIES: nitrate reductase cytochrome c-type subunit [Shewanella]|uniref:Periplasmic nitrate reductase, electron transfer subunit n=1 Tax=Shewanella japonica TaxID=93973 RepID=A0ABM6JFZ4_9GAMM|nr:MULTISPECIES: nitrate reductase cytochrome c-type subunit [Shewanella]ARD21058.1 Nitrate reductase cytochrome c-type subunit [Shewanella japonica]KPZ73555.1 Periplasmic nitrate reductase, electron transfer subunit precursor [Shewanella sp. P1-14-1]MBQ4890545.1 nitrate reductase cytochrome c-type subunit [Shewanella sp. MMG014]OBT06938.1 nitrate reductase [Shewanella sp. UCD-FRSSP16_17]